MDCLTRRPHFQPKPAIGAFLKFHASPPSGHLIGLDHRNSGTELPRPRYEPELRMSGGELQQSCGGAPEDVGLLVVGERIRRENMVDRMQLKWIGIVATQHNLTGADLGHQMPDRLRREDHRIEIDLLEILRRRFL